MAAINPEREGAAGEGEKSCTGSPWATRASKCGSTALMQKVHEQSGAQGASAGSWWVPSSRGQQGLPLSRFAEAEAEERPEAAKTNARRSIRERMRARCWFTRPLKSNMKPHVKEALAVLGDGVREGWVVAKKYLDGSPPFPLGFPKNNACESWRS
jgi:hypothetical protein